MESMAAILNGQPGDVTTVLQYEDDSVEVQYGAKISLSACGAALARRESGKSTSGADVHQLTYNYRRTDQYSI